jgi:hypothetical protein
MKLETDDIKLQKNGKFSCFSTLNLQSNPLLIIYRTTIRPREKGPGAGGGGPEMKAVQNHE